MKNRDGGLPASPFFSSVHSRLKVPLNALYFTVILVIIFGCIFLGSSSAFNAIISASVVMLDIAYGIPIAVNCLRGRNMLPERQFVLPNVVGWILNIVRSHLMYDGKVTNYPGLSCLYYSNHRAVLVPAGPSCYGKQHE